jgi:sulfatase modifying factor 1
MTRGATRVEKCWSRGPAKRGIAAADCRANPGSTETGAYTLVNGQTTGTAPARNPGATFSIPTENEWYKVAYYKGGSTNAGYWDYATQSDAAPGNTIGSSANQANYHDDSLGGSGYAVTQSKPFNGSQNYLTDVGAFSNSASVNGTFDQSGNVYEWNDLTGAAGSTRGLRGGEWNGFGASNVSKSVRGDTVDPSLEQDNVGFRLAYVAATGVPEIDPAGMGSVLALVTGALGLFERRRLKVA